MTTLQIEKSNALNAYQNGDTKEKGLLERLFGKNTFLSPIERIKTFEDACVELGITTEIPFEFDDEQNSFFDEVVTRYKLSVIAKALQEGWKPDWKNSNEAKWYVWFKYKAVVGFVVYDAYYGRTDSHSTVGSRLCFPTSELAKYFGEQFIELHRIVLEN